MKVEKRNNELKTRKTTCRIFLRLLLFHESIVLTQLLHSHLATLAVDPLRTTEQQN